MLPGQRAVPSPWTVAGRFRVTGHLRMSLASGPPRGYKMGIFVDRELGVVPHSGIASTACVLVVVRSPFGLEVVETAPNGCDLLLLPGELVSRLLDFRVKACPLRSPPLG